MTEPRDSENPVPAPPVPLEGALDNVPPVEGMALSLHRSEATYNRYYRAGALKDNRASCLLSLGDAAKDEAP